MGIATQAKFLLGARAAIGTPGERVCAVGGLSTADALRVFVERLRARKREADLKAPGAREAIEALVGKLGGHPLAIEIAASFTDRVSPAVLHAELASAPPGSAASVSEPGVAEERRPGSAASVILTAVLDACAKYLEPWELDALAQLSVFAASATVDLASATLVLADGPGASVHGAIRTLRSRGLLRAWEPPDLPGETRLAMHPAVRQPPGPSRRIDQLVRRLRPRQCPNTAAAARRHRAPWPK